MMRRVLNTCFPVVTFTSHEFDVTLGFALCRGRCVHAAYCYRRAAVAWSVYPCGLLLQTRSSGVVGLPMRPIATDAQQWRGRSIHAAYCNRRTAVAWSVCPCGLLLQPRSSGMVGPSMRPIATDAQQWRSLVRTTGWPTYRLCLAFLVIIIIVIEVMEFEQNRLKRCGRSCCIYRRCPQVGVRQ